MFNITYLLILKPNEVYYLILFFKLIFINLADHMLPSFIETFTMFELISKILERNQAIINLLINM